MLDAESLEAKIEHGGLEDAQRTIDREQTREGSRGEAKRLLVEGLLLYRRGDYRDAMSRLSRGLEIACEKNDKKLECRLSNQLIWIYLRVGRKKGIKELFEKMERGIGQGGRRNQAFFFINHAFAISLDIGFIESQKFSEGLVRNAHERLREAERIAGKRDMVILLRAKLVSGILYQEEGAWELGEKELEQAEETAGIEGLPFLRAELLEELGNLHFRYGEETRAVNPEEAVERFRMAKKAFESAMRIWRGINPDEEGVLNSALGDVHYYLRDYQKAGEHHSIALDKFKELDYPHGIGLQLDALGRVALRTGRVKEGLRLLKKALGIFNKLNVDHEI
ncbi:MAG: hypothetical protein KAU14_03470, partial [Thermoplasmata archaeon]|nr:hypothetical protein [Thermoplasmata archaeon]